MEALSILEQKITALLDSKRQDLEQIKLLRSDMEKVCQENLQLRDSLEKIETTLLSRHENFEELAVERSRAKTMVDDLIKSIDLLIEAENHQ